jgi:predicted nicotinamide N-methyase
MGNQFYRSLVDNIEIRTISLGNRLFTIEAVGDTDKLIDSLDDAEFKKEDRFPYWAELWPSSIALSQYILNNKPLFKNKKVLELGCGLGLTGLAARAADAVVVFSDYDPLSLEFTRRNFDQLPKVMLLDWRKPLIEEEFDLIIGADILYERKMMSPLLNVCRQAVRKDGMVLLAEPGRMIAREFLSMAVHTGWTYKTRIRTVDLNGKKHKIHIYRINPCST